MPKVRGFQTFAATRFVAGLFVAGMLVAGVLPGIASAQQMPRLAGTPDRDSNQQDSQADPQDQSVSTLKVNVNVVQLFFNVKDKKGGLIPNLAKDDFQILEDGKPQS